MNALVELLTDDFLVLDLGKPCRSSEFLEIERAMLKGKAHTSCGGRHPNNDIMDTLFTLYIAGLDGKRIRDGEDKTQSCYQLEISVFSSSGFESRCKGKGGYCTKAFGNLSNLDIRRIRSGFCESRLF